MIKIRKQFDPDYKSSDYSTPGGGESVVQQHLKDQCNVNKIMNKYVKTGVLEHIKENQGFYGDCIGIDFRSVQDKVIRGQEAFNALPAKIRKLMNNDPANFVEWMNSDEDLDMKRELGLLKPAEPTNKEAKKEKSVAVSEPPKEIKAINEKKTEVGRDEA